MKRLLGAWTLLGVAAAACTGPHTITVRVGAAASLEAVFSQLGESFQASAPDIGVEFTFAGTPTLVTQIREAAPIDVFASADEENMGVAVAEGLIVGTPVVFAHNDLEIAVAVGNPRGIAGLADLADPGLTVVLAAPEVPAGRYARRTLAAAGVPIPPAAFEPSVAAVVARLALGEADAGIVYRTDVAAAGGSLIGVEIPTAFNVRATYLLGVVSDGENQAAARTFVDFVVSDAGRALLMAAGFGVP